MIKRNALSNLVSKIWNIFSLFIFVPYYLHYLGDSGFGYIAFYNTLLALLAVADLGFSAAITREFARMPSTNVELLSKKSNLLYSYQIIYFFIVVTVACLIILSSTWISAEWLVSNDGYDVKTIVIIMGLSISLQLPTNLYIGALMGDEKQILANTLQIVWGMFRSLGVLPVLHFISNSIYSFFIWQLISNILFLIVLYFFVWKGLAYKKVSFDRVVIKSTYKYAFGMAGMSLLASIATQIDKIIVSKNYAIDAVGYYSLGSTLALIPLILITTLAKAVFPKFTRLYEFKKLNELKVFYLVLARLTAIVVIPLSFVFAIFGFTLVQTWTGSTVIAEKIQYVVMFLMLAQMIQSLTVLPFYLSLSFGYVRGNLIFPILMIIEIPSIYYIFFTEFNLVGLSLSVLVTSIINFIPYMFILHKKMFDSIFIDWMKINLVVVLLCFIISYIFYLINGFDFKSVPESILTAILIWGIMTLSALWFSSFSSKKSIKDIFSYLS